MRLWHYELIPYLPRRQLLSQWRELNSIFVKQDKNRLINYIYDYPKLDLLEYTFIVIKEMNNRHYHINSFKNAFVYFNDLMTSDIFTLNYIPNEFIDGFLSNRNIFRNHHNKRYLLQCFYNLQEKYEKGFDISKEEFEKLEKYVIDRLGDARLYDLLLFV